MTLPALANLSDFADIALNRALTDHNERNIWDAIVDAQNTLLGDNGFETVVEYIDPPGHRVAAGGDYTDPTYDPIPDLIAGKTLLATKGKRPAGIYASTEVLNTLLANPKVQARTGNAVFIDGAFQTQNPMTTPEALNRVLLANGLPPVTTYDETYNTSTGTEFFLKRDVMVMTSRADEDRVVDLGAGANIALPESLGYLAVGVAQGEGAPGRVIQMEYRRDKPRRIEGEGWQTSAPVMTDPESVFVITDIVTG
jgi:hypothetical protein